MKMRITKNKKVLMLVAFFLVLTMFLVVAEDAINNYDNQGRILSEEYKNNPEKNIYYNYGGELLSSIQTSNGISYYKYDSQDRIISIELGIEKENFEYYGDGVLKNYKLTNNDKIIRIENYNEQGYSIYAEENNQIIFSKECTSTECIINDNGIKYIVEIPRDGTFFNYSQKTQQITKGWNMIAAETGTTVEDLINQSCLIYKAYGFEGANYSEVVSFESGKGYYVYSVNNCSYEVAAHEAIVEMNDGWNLVNLPKGNLKENFPGATIAWSWDGSKYDRADDLISPTAAFVYWSEK